LWRGQHLCLRGVSWHARRGERHEQCGDGEHAERQAGDRVALGGQV